MAGSRPPSKTPSVAPPATDMLSVDCSKWVFAGLVAENQQLTQVVEQQQQEMVDKTQAHLELVKKTRLLEKKVDEEVERMRAAKRKLKAAELEVDEQDSILKDLRRDLEIAEGAATDSKHVCDDAIADSIALRKQLDETKAELSSAQTALDESKATSQKDLDTIRAECETLRKALETSKSETVAKQTEVSTFSQIIKLQAMEEKERVREFSQLAAAFGQFGRRYMQKAEDFDGIVVEVTAPDASLDAGVPMLTRGGSGSTPEAGPSTPSATWTSKHPSKRKAEDDRETTLFYGPGADLLYRAGVLRPGTKKARAESATNGRTNTVGAHLPLVPLPTAPTGDEPTNFTSSRTSARTCRQPQSVDEDAFMEISICTDNEKDMRPDIATTASPSYDPDDLDDICLMHTPDSYGVKKIPPEWSSPSNQRTPRRKSAHTKGLRDISSSGSVKKRTLKVGTLSGDARATLQGDDDDDQDPINL